MTLPVNVKFDMGQLEALLGRYARNAKQVKNFLDIAGSDVATAIDDLIQSEGDGQWDPLSVVTEKLHPRRVGGKLLQGPTGQLANMQIEPGGNYVDIISPAPYGIYHHTGTEKVRGWVHSDKGMPARDFLAIDLGATLDKSGEAILAEIV